MRSPKTSSNTTKEDTKTQVTYIPSGIKPRVPQKLLQNLHYNVPRHGYFLYVGRLSKEKRIEDLIQAYQQIQHCSVKLVIVGKERPEDKIYVDSLKQLSEDNPQIIFTGAVYGDALIEWYSNALAYVLPSAIEGLPITLLEAMSFSRCCIASDIPANTEALDGKGLTYPLGDIQTLRKQLEYTINNPDVVQSTGDNLLRHAYNHYTWHSIAEKFSKFYQKKYTHRLQTNNISKNTVSEA